ncbi:hypothetical protein, partial [Endozoicomonas acroporae]|uniref:hypothetical protein n=1 Tax=Endozoicomonas acroporae TaxID=1701104 RepID=UPI003D7BEF78
AACETELCRTKTRIAWALVDTKQDIGILIGVGGGIGLSAYEAAEALAIAVLNPVDTYNGLKAVLNDPAVREQLGNDVIASYEERLSRLSQAREDAGWNGSITNGVEGGRLALEIVTAVQGVTALGKTLTKLPAGSQKAMTAISSSVKRRKGNTGDSWNNVVSRKDGDFGYLPPLRQKYVQDVYDLQQEVDAMRKAGHSPEEIARFASNRRNEIKKPILEATPPDFLEKIKQRNLEKYQNETGPTIEQLRAQGKTWEQITNGATRAGGGDLF